MNTTNTNTQQLDLIPPPPVPPRKLVTLIHFPGKGLPNEQWVAADLLLFTKATRLEMSPESFEAIRAQPAEEKLAGLKYMAETIPSSWEFVDYVFLVSGVSRAYTHQQVRTRAGTYAQQSLRVVNAEDFEYVFTDRNLTSAAARNAISECVETIRETYAKLIELGQPAEDARGILPTNIATNIVCKFNLRTLSELAKSRTGGRTQSEYRTVIWSMITEVLAVHPWTGLFLFGNRSRNYFREIEAFAEEQFGHDLKAKGQLLKIVDQMRKEVQ